MPTPYTYQKGSDIIKRRFSSKRKYTKTIPHIILILVITYISYLCTFQFLFNRYLKDTVTNEQIINYLIDHNLNNHLTTAKTLNDIFRINLKSPEIIIKHSVGSLITFAEDESETHDTGKNSSYIEDPNPTPISEPLVYIYNTHQTEAYDSKALANYNIEPNVLMASYLLREKLNDLGVPTIVETTNIKDVLSANNWPYSRSYEASKILITKAKQDYPSLKFFIDLHRDSSVREKTTTTIHDATYAKVLFVVGKEHETYQSNLDLATTLNTKIKQIDNSLSRGIYVKEGPGVNGIYNQDLSPNSVLVELGGQYNTIEEASRTINLLSQILAEYIKENL